jgi:hypothetical protein
MKFEDWPRLFGHRFVEFVERGAGGVDWRGAVARYPPAVRLFLIKAGAAPAGEAWRRYVEDMWVEPWPLVKFTPRGPPRAVEKPMRCGPSIFLLPRNVFSRNFPRYCTYLHQFITEAVGPLGKRRAGRGYYLYNPLKWCEAVKALAERLGVSDPWEAASLYFAEGGRRRHLQGLAALIYWCSTGGRSPEADYYLGRLQDVEPAPRFADEKGLEEYQIIQHSERGSAVEYYYAVVEYYFTTPHGGYIAPRGVRVKRVEPEGQES